MTVLKEYSVKRRTDFEFYKEILDDQTFFEEIKSLIKNERYTKEV